MLQAHSSLTTSVALIAAILVAQPCEGGAPAIDTSGKWWVDEAATRPLPFIWDFDARKCDLKRGDDGYVHPSCPEQWNAYLNTRNLETLHAATGGRAYRWFWDGEMSKGFVQLSVGIDGKRLLLSSASHHGSSVSAGDVSQFELALAQSRFPATIPDDGSSGLDACQTGVLEAVVNGKYRFVDFPCGFPEDIFNALHPIEKIAGFGPPVDDHCFFLPPDCLVVRPQKSPDRHD
jgi:hypothetical protein